ncbi:MAG TPA: tRNA lysidine(34) synthetase TilS [Stellaceae bacterium]|nr:tRNA lysidine(34) synthetase TilS [Stellaceae bacterium]
MPESCAAAPLSLPEFAASLAAIGGFEARPALAVAVSGGPDSMALMLLAEGWARQRGGTVWGLTVDHGLRPESAAEAQRVGLWLAARGIRHVVLTWQGEKPRSGIQERAREARYRLLAGWCRDAGVLHLLTAHHREDQAETYLIRRRAGSGVDGLAGMPAVRELAGCRLVRPLLDVPRACLADALAVEGQPYLRDPSNDNPAFERVRLRGDGGLSGRADEIVATIRVCADRRIAREQMLDALLGRTVALHPAGFAVLDPAVLAADGDAVERLLGRVARTIGGASYPARLARLARLREALGAWPERGRTLGGCRFVPWRGRLLVLREPAAAEPPVRLAAGRVVAWDRRFATALPAAAPDGMILGYLAQSGSPAQDAAALAHVSSDVPRVAWPALPALWNAQGLVAVPHLGYYHPAVECLPLLSFRPVHPLTGAGFTVVQKQGHPI